MLKCLVVCAAALAAVVASERSAFTRKLDDDWHDGVALFHAVPNPGSVPITHAIGPTGLAGFFGAHSPRPPSQGSTGQLGSAFRFMDSDQSPPPPPEPNLPSWRSFIRIRGLGEAASPPPRLRGPEIPASVLEKANVAFHEPPTWLQTSQHPWLPDTAPVPRAGEGKPGTDQRLETQWFFGKHTERPPISAAQEGWFKGALRSYMYEHEPYSYDGSRGSAGLPLDAMPPPPSPPPFWHNRLGFAGMFGPDSSDSWGGPWAQDTVTAPRLRADASARTSADAGGQGGAGFDARRLAAVAVASIGVVAAAVALKHRRRVAADPRFRRATQRQASRSRQWLLGGQPSPVLLV